MEKKDDIQHLHLNLERLEQAIDSLEHAFSWCNTKEGYDYWLRISTRLKELTKQRCEKCGQVVYHLSFPCIYVDK